MIENYLYNILDLSRIENNNFITAKLQLNKEHVIFKGHFPDNPVLPGVCLIQIVKEILSKATNKDLTLVSAGNIKFLEFVNPEIFNLLGLEINILPQKELIENTNLKIHSIVKFDDKPCFKMSAEFKVI
jgi:3-hydroxyacyl-[acyl-carrier-protein] dehydratase